MREKEDSVALANETLGSVSAAGIFLTNPVLRLEEAKGAVESPAEAPLGPVPGGINFWAIP